MRRTSAGWCSGIAGFGGAGVAIAIVVADVIVVVVVVVSGTVDAAGSPDTSATVEGDVGSSSIDTGT
jgi:hypothetical protein